MTIAIHTGVSVDRLPITASTEFDKAELDRERWPQGRWEVWRMPEICAMIWNASRDDRFNPGRRTSLTFETRPTPSEGDGASNQVKNN